MGKIFERKKHNIVELNQRDTVKPDAIEPDAIEPDAIEPDAIEPDAIEPDVIKPDVRKPDVVKPDVRKPYARKPDVVKPDTGKNMNGQKNAENRKKNRSGLHRPSNFQDYMAILAIVPSILAVMAYEFLDWAIYMYRPDRTDYDPLTGLGILIPMTLLTEFFMFFFSSFLTGKIKKLTEAIEQIAKDEYREKLNPEKMAPFKEVTASLNQMSDELKSVEVLRKDFISDFSHEFKTPIVSINGFADLLLHTEVTPEEQKQYLEIIAEESGRLSHMSQQTLLLSRLDTQTKISDCSNFSLDDQIRRKVILLSGDWEKKNIEMDVYLEPMEYYGNPEIMSHVWINLLNNAIKFTPEGGKISLRGFHSGERLIVEVEDNGPGMSEEACKRIFDRFYQADPSHATKGLGLGLSIVARIMQLCGGEITVRSKEGKGTCFTVVLNTGAANGRTVE